MIADGTTFTRKFTTRQVLFGRRRAYQRKVAVAEFDGLRVLRKICKALTIRMRRFMCCAVAL